MPYVFGYASLVSPASIEATLKRPLAAGDGPHLGRLVGTRRAWNVVAHASSRHDYEFHRPDGTPWTGWMTFLGLEEAVGESTVGAFYSVTAEEVARLDLRELSYDRVDVTDRLEPLGWTPRDAPVEVYWPRPAVVAQADRIGPDRTVMARYLRLVDDAYRRLGPERHAEHLRTIPDLTGCRVEEIHATPLDKNVLSEAVDPGRPTTHPGR